MSTVLQDLLSPKKKAKVYTIPEARELGIDVGELEEDWLLKEYAPDRISAIDPEGWEYLPWERVAVSPQGERISYADLEADLVAADQIEEEDAAVRILGKLFPEGTITVSEAEAGEVTEPRFEMPTEWTTVPDAQGNLIIVPVEVPTVEPGLTFETRTILTIAGMEDVADIASKYPQQFLEYIVSLGRSEEAEVLLGAFGLTEQDIDSLFDMQDTPLKMAFGDVFGDEDINEKILWARENPIAFMGTLQKIGWSHDVERLLRTLHPEMTDAEIRAVFPKETFDYQISDSWDAFTAGVGDVIQTIGGISRWMGAEGMGQGLSEFGEFLQQQGPPDTLGVFQWSHLLNPRFYAERVTRALPFTLSLIPGAIAGAYGGAAVAGVVGLGAFGKLVLGSIGAALMSRPIESALEAGGAYDEAKAMGYSDEEAGGMAAEVFRNNMTLAGVDAAQFALAFAPAPARIGRILISRGLVRTAVVAGKITIVGLTEAGEEIYQDVIKRLALKQEIHWDAEMKEVAAIGGIMGLGLGGGAEVYTRIKRQTIEQMPEAARVPFEREKARFIELGIDEETAELLALDGFAETDDGKNLIAYISELNRQKEFMAEFKPRNEQERLAQEWLFEQVFPDAMLLESIEPVVEPTPTPIIEASSFTGVAYRVETGFVQDPDTTAADVVRYEQVELANELGVSDAMLAELQRHPATDVVWVTRNREDALRYLAEGETEASIQEVKLGAGARIVAEDGEGGFLVLKEAPEAPAVAVEVELTEGVIVVLKEEGFHLPSGTRLKYMGTKAGQATLVPVDDAGNPIKLTTLRGNVIDSIGIAESLVEKRFDIEGAIPAVAEVPVAVEPPPIAGFTRDEIVEMAPSDRGLIDTAFAAIGKLTQTINYAVPVREETEVLKHEELAKRSARLAQQFNRIEGWESFFGGMAQLRGQLPKARFEAPDTQMQPEESAALINHVQMLPDKRFKPFTKLNTGQALQKVLMGQMPTRGEIQLLEKAFGTDLAKAILKHRTGTERFWENAMNAWNLPKATLASWDLSAPLRQGAVLFPAQYKQSIPALYDMVRAAASVKYMNELFDGMRESKWWDIAQKVKLSITGVGGVSRTLQEREEAFMTGWAKYIPGVSISERAYVTYLNKLRFDVFSYYADKWEAMGHEATQGDYTALAEFINNATGRGSLGRFESTGPALNALLFSPKLQASRIKLPLSLFRGSKAVRMIAIKNMLAFFGMGMMALALMKLAGADIEEDPRSSDFGKVRVGNTRLDFWAGFQQYARLLGQLITSQRHTAAGRIQDLNRLDIAWRFLESKFSPSTGLIRDVLKGETYIGEKLEAEPASVAEQMYQRLTPLFIQDIIDAMEQEGVLGGLVALPGFLGVGVVSYPDRLEEYVNQLGKADPQAEGEIYKVTDLWTKIRSMTSGMVPDDVLPEKGYTDMIQAIVGTSLVQEEYLALEDADAKEEWLRANPDKNAELAVWGKAKPLTQASYDKAWTLINDLGIPENALADNFPPKEVATPFFGYNDVLRQGFSGGSAEAKLVRLENPEFDAWGQQEDVYAWEPLDDKIEALRISVQYRENDEAYDAIQFDDASLQRERRSEYLEHNAEYARARRQREAYQKDIPEQFIENYIEYYSLPSSGGYRQGYLLSHREYYEQVWLGILENKPVTAGDIGLTFL